MISPALFALADRFRRSRSSARDFTVEYETLLREAGLDDGDAREIAETDLRLAERESGGVLALDLAKRSRLPIRVRLRREGGAAWLYGRIGQASPGEERMELAAFFRCASLRDCSPDWRNWCEGLAQRAEDGGSLRPFARNDREGNREFLEILLGVLRWEGESLIRFASSVICGDSKSLERNEPRLLIAIRSIRNNEALTLEDLGILRKPRTLNFHGSLSVMIAGEVIDFSRLPGPCGISETNLLVAEAVLTTATLCLTVENEEVFLELAKQNTGCLLVLTSFPGAAVRCLFARLPTALRCLHFGDCDPAGFDILRDLREKTGRHFGALCMEFRPSGGSPALSAEEQKTIHRLLSNPLMQDTHPVLQTFLEENSKGRFEQETVPIPDVFAAIRSAVRAAIS